MNTSRSGSTRQALVRFLRRHTVVELRRRFSRRAAEAIFTFINGTLSIGILAAVALLADAPFIFPSLGPTAYLLFYRPKAAASTPRSTVLGHLIGAVCGWMSLAVFGLADQPSAFVAGMEWARVGAAALSLGSTGALMILFRASHPPAGATTLIISLGVMGYLWHLPVLMGAVGLLVLQALAVNRLLGINYPLWKSLKKPAPRR